MPDSQKIKILDHGFIQYIEHWGSDERVIEAARMSTNKGFQGWGPKCRNCGGSFAEVENEKCSNPSLGKEYVDCGKNWHMFDSPGDEKLLRYLWEHKHATPFEMAGLVIEVQAPIFVFREWHRHRTQSYNEMSARYTPLPDVNYIPTVERLMMNSKINKQAGVIAGAEELTEREAENFRISLWQHYQHCETMYQRALNAGIPKELARIHLPVGRYSRMRASANLRNWLAFLTLRMDKAAQWEIRMFANAVGEIIAKLFPRTWELFIGKRV